MYTMHYVLCGHGEECVMQEGNEELKVATKSVYEYHECKWHGYPCQPETNKHRYEKTKAKVKAIQELGYNLVTV